MTNYTQFPKLKRFISIYIFFLIFSFLFNLLVEYIYLQNNPYPFSTNIFNSNKYLGLQLIMQIIITGVLSPILEEIVQRFWIVRRDIGINIRLFLLLTFLTQVVLFFINIINPKYQILFFTIIENIKGFDSLLFIPKQLIFLYLIPLCTAMIFFFFFRFFDSKGIKNTSINNFISTNYLIIAVIASIYFSISHLEINFGLISFGIIIPILTRFFLGYFLFYIMNITNLKISILFHSLNNFVALLGFTIFWKNSNAKLYTYSIIIVIVIITTLLYKEFNKIRLKNNKK